MPNYPRIPDPPDEQPDAIADGFALLAYTMREGIAPIVTAPRLQRAERAAMLAGMRRPDESRAAVDSIRRAQNAIGAALRRAQAAEAETTPATIPAPATGPQHEGNTPTHPAPYTRPPAPAARPLPAAPVSGGQTLRF